MRQLRGVDQAACLVVQRTANLHEIGLPQQGRQVHQFRAALPGLFRRQARVHRQHPHAERTGAACDLGSDGAEADDGERLAGDRLEWFDPPFVGELALTGDGDLAAVEVNFDDSSQVVRKIYVKAGQHVRKGQLLARIDRSGGTLGLIEADDTGRGFPTPNAATPDGEGGLYFSSSGMFSPQAPATGAVLYLDAKGGLRRVADGIHYSNGVALSPDGRTLFVSEHLSRNVLAFDVAADGGLSGRRIFLHLDDIVGADPDRGWEVGPDGLAVDREGNLFIAEYGGGRILVVDRAGSLRATIRVPEAYVTSMVLVPDEARLFITAPATIFATGGAVYSAANPLRQPD